MTAEENSLDLILATRLELLTQAVDEVNQVIAAMVEQNDRLTQVEEFLSGQGALSRAEARLIRMVGDARTRLEVALHDVPEAARPRRLDVGSIRHQQDGDSGSPLTQVAEHINLTLQEISKVTAARRETWDSFQDVRRWSIAGLANTGAKIAAHDYQQVIKSIRSDAHPWARYEAEIPGRGYKLFDQYLELVAGMAVRGFGLDAAIMSDVHQLIKLLREPLPSANQPRGSVGSPLTLMGSLGKHHLPLGYPEWSLWALPLVGRSVGEEVVDLLLEGKDDRARLLCADLYAQYVLGPSYVVAATFLEFEPNPDAVRSGAADDALRVQTLLEMLPALGEGQQQGALTPIVEAVGREWQRARSAFNCVDPVLDKETRRLIDGFLATLANDYPDTAYDVASLAENTGAGEELADPSDPEHQSPDNLPQLSTRELMCAMWQGRLQHPTRAAQIHKRAKMIASGSRNASPSGISSTRGR